MIQNRPPKGRRTLLTFLLSLVILVGGGLRLYNPLWDSGTFPHPDERSTLLFYATQIRWPEDQADLLDPQQSTLNPFWDVRNQSRRSYTYGHFPLYSLVATSAFLNQLVPWAESLAAPTEVIDFLRQAPTGHGYMVIGRILVALFDTLSIYLVFLIGHRLYGPWAGLLAATLSAFAVSHIQLAHFFAVDPVSTFFVLLTVYGSLLMLHRRTAGAALLTGVAIGLAVSSKYSALPVVLVPAMAGLLISNEYKDSDNPTPSAPTGGLGVALRLISIAAITSFIIFALTSPFVLLDYENFHQAVVEEQGAMVSGAADMPFTRQYRQTTPYLYFIEQQVKWGLGWSLGVLAFAGFAWALLRAVIGRLRPGEWLILAWLVPYFGLNGLFLAKFMRYMSPVTPLIIVLGGGMLAVWGQQLGQKSAMLRRLMVGLAGVVCLGTIVWAIMFVNGVYATEHSWVTASRWIYDNVPDGSCIAREHWEESVPRDWGWLEPEMSPGRHGYFQPDMPMYDPDTEQKYERLRDTLRQCDYLVIASNRMTRTLPRLIERYPLSTAYYEALFAEKLGYQLVFVHETPPRLGSLVVDDQPADESFTVYDHPKAFIFQKTVDLSEAEWFSLLGNTWQGAIHGYVGPPTLLMKLRGADNVPSLTGNFADQGHNQAEAEETTWLQKPLREWPVIVDWSWNDRANEDPIWATVIWWLAIQVIGLAAFPLTFILFARLADKGYLFSKSLGLLLVSYGAWILAGLGWPANRLVVIGAGLGLLALIGLILAVRSAAQIGQWWRSQWRYVLLGEVIFAAVFVLFVFFRMANPDLWQPWRGGEKMLEIGFLSAIVKSAYMPPYDPFFAGTFINYYYYGLYLANVIIKLTGIEPVVAFNLAVPMLAALTAVNVFSLAGNLGQLHDPSPQGSWSKRGMAGVLALLFVLFFSNLDGMGQFLRNLAEISDLQFSSAIPGLETLVKATSGLMNALGGVQVREYDFWDPSRVIPFTINEFPYWSFLFADLHPHMIGIPFTVLFLGLAYAWLKPVSGASEIKAPIQTTVAVETRETMETNEAVMAAPPDNPVDSGTFAVDINEPSGDQMTATTPAELPPQSPLPFWTDLKKTIAQEGAGLKQRILVGTVWGTFWRWLALPFVLGAVAVINTWDLPTYVGIMGAAFVLSRYRAGQRPLTLAWGLVLFGEMIAFTVVLLGATLLMYRPFFANYMPPVGGLGLVTDKIPFDEFFTLWGFFLLVLCTWLVWQLWQPRTRFASLRAFSLFVKRANVLPHLIEVYRPLVRQTQGGYKNSLGVIGAILILAILLFGVKYYVVGVLLPWTLIAFLLLLRWDVKPEQSFVGLLIFTGLLILLGVQFVFLEDFLGGGDYYRMNTYFKFFIQVWVLFGLAAGAILPSLWLRADGWSFGWRWTWQMVVVAFIFSSLVFFVLGTRQRNDYRFPGPRPAEASLNGMDYMTVGQFTWNNDLYELKYDYEAIRWLQRNVVGTPIIAEAKIGYYREAGMRVAAYTGLPSILGGLHQNEQHSGRQVGERDGLVQQFWLETDPTRFMDLAQRLEVEYIYFGQLEQSLYGQFQLQKFAQLIDQGVLEIVFENERTRIYRFV